MKQAGFTLVEVMVAFAITTLFATALYEAGGVALRLHRKGATLSLATLVAESAYTQWTLKPDTTSGVDSGCAWRIQTRPFDVQSRIIDPRLASKSPFNPRSVGIEVTCGSADNRTKVEFERVALARKEGA